MRLDPRDDVVREQLAEDAYLRFVREEHARMSEQDADRRAYFYVPWGQLPAEAKRPIRAAVAECMDAVIHATQQEDEDEQDGP